METLLATGLLGAGYLLGQQGGKNERESVNPYDDYRNPSQDNIYQTQYYPETKNIESDYVDTSFRNAKNAIETNVVPPQFNQKIFNTDNTGISYLQRPKIQMPNSNVLDSNNVVISQLSGTAMAKNEYTNENLPLMGSDTVDSDLYRETFTHQNMVPFFGSHITQVTDEKANRSILENHTGAGYYDYYKKEPKPLFKPTKDLSIQYGTQNENTEIQNRIIPTMYRQNELPFEQIIVGPSLNGGFNELPTGGFHPDTRDYIMPKNIDQLRPLSKPQISYKGRVVSGSAPVTRLGSIGKVEKYHPDAFFINSPDRYLTGQASVLRESKRPFVISKDTNRKNSRSYAGSAAPAIKKNIEARADYKKSTKQNFLNDYLRNTYYADGWTIDECSNEQGVGDYGKSATSLPANERDITGKRTHTTNLQAYVKAVIAPLLDVMKTTRKENVEGNIRQTGNFGNGQLMKNVVWDANDVLRTTIKETSLHDNNGGYMGANQKGVVWDSNDTLKTTTKETTVDHGVVNNLKGPIKLTVYDPNDIPKTTTKETTVDSGDRTGNIGNLQSRNGGYMTNPQEMPNTSRQFQSVEYTGVANSYLHKPESYDSDYNARINEVKEGTLQGRYPTPVKDKLIRGSDTINVKFNKIEGDYINTRENSSTKVYNSIPQLIPCAYTTEKNYYKDEELLLARIEPETLNAFRSNPYTQSLSSYAFP